MKDVNDEFRMTNGTAKIAANTHDPVAGESGVALRFPPQSMTRLKAECFGCSSSVATGPLLLTQVPPIEGGTSYPGKSELIRPKKSKSESRGQSGDANFTN